MKKFSDLYNDLASRINEDLTNATRLANVKRWLNTSYQMFQSMFTWSWRLKATSIKLIPIYDDGLVTVTQDSKTVTGSGTAFTSAMVGRYFRANTEEDTYKIVAVTSGTVLVIDKPYIKATKTSASYQIWKRFYSLPSDVQEINEVYSENTSKRLSMCDFNNPFSVGSPYAYKLAGLQRKDVSYNTGTLSASAGTYTLTGSGTAWIENVTEGDEIVVGSLTFNVASVDSDTQITTLQEIETAINASTSYTAYQKQNNLIEFSGTPDEAVIIHINYFKKSYDMVSDDDVPEVPERYRDAIVLGAIPLNLSEKYIEGSDVKQINSYDIFNRRVRQIIAEQENENDNTQFSWS